MMTAERNRRTRLASRRALKSVDRLLSALQRELTDLEGDRRPQNPRMTCSRSATPPPAP